ncbi:MAG: hypothetical protein Q8O92_12890 [Candidatus Latescibacter sp.]|nr:hypothetical protein [Candidatus Latescibacter sp.]
MAIYTITLTNDKSGEEISKRIFLFGDRPDFNTILRDMRELLIRRITEKVTF